MMTYGHQSHSSAQIPPIHNYAEACEREAGIKPIRGTDIKPLGLRRHKHMQIIKNADESIACRLYHTDVVTYKPDGDIVVQINGYASPTTIAFMSHVLLAKFLQFDSQVWWHEVYGAHRKFPLLTHGDNIFRRTGSGDLALINPQMCKVHKINRQGANNVRNRYQSFRDYIDRTVRLRAGDGKVDIGIDELKEMFSNDKGSLEMPPRLSVDMHYIIPKESLAEFQQLIEDHGVVDKTQDFYRAFLWLAKSVDIYAGYNGVDKTMLYKQLDQITFFIHRGEAFVETELFGESKRDPYYKFFS